VAPGSPLSDLPKDWRQQPLEGQVTNLADRIAYDVHDIEDALGAELISEQDLRDIRLWRLAADPVRREWPDLMLPAIRRHILDALTLHLVGDLVATTNHNLAAQPNQAWETFCKADAPAVAFSPATETMLAEHETFLSERAYQHPRVAAMDYKARLIIRAVFEAHVKQPRLLPVRYFRRIDEQGLHRVVCDYIAGMTDRFCQDTYHTLFEPFQRL
jgi:dGTPase